MSEQNTAAIIEAARQVRDATIIDVNVGDPGKFVPMLIRPATGGGLIAESVKAEIDKYRERPERRTGTATLGDLDSFIAHAVRFKDRDSAVFVVGGDEEHAPTFLAVLDYHESIADRSGPRVGTPEPDALPRFGKHRGSYTPEFSAEWEAWTGADKRAKTQAEFAEFIQEHAADVFEGAELGSMAEWFASRFGGRVHREGGGYFASCQTLLDLSEGLAVTVTDRVGESVKRDSGATRITFESDATTSVDIPPAFVIAIPVFEGGDLYQIPVRLRMTLRTSGDTKRTEWKLELYGAAKTFKAAVDDAIEKVRDVKGTGLPVFVGSPEA